MNFPEQQLAAYLRVFLPQEGVDEMLDTVATTAIAAEAQGPIEFFCLAHWLMETDEARTVESEVVALIEEAGLSVKETAIVLDLSAEEVAAVRDRAWADTGGRAPRSVDDEVELPEGADDGRRAVPTADSAVAGGIDPGVRRAPTASGPPLRVARYDLAVAVAVAGVVGLAGLAFVMFSSAGRARLAAHGIDPVLAYVVIVALVVGGGALVGLAITGGGSDRAEP